MEGQLVEYVSLPRLVGDSSTQLVAVHHPVHEQVNQVQHCPKAQKQPHRHRDEGEVVRQVEEHVYAFHRVGRGGLLEVVLNSLEVQQAGEVAEGKQSAEDWVDGVQEGEREVGQLHESDHFEGDDLAHSED